MTSGLISDDDIQKVREATDLVQLVSERVVLKPKGKDLWGCCPLHNEKTPSFKVDPSSQFWHCFGCDEGGDIFGFIMKLDGLTFPDAVRKLAERANIEISRYASNSKNNSHKDKLKQIYETSKEFYHKQLMRGTYSGAQNARKYLASRNLGGEVPKNWALGYSPGSNILVNELTKKGFTKDELISSNIAVLGKDGKLHDRFFNRIMFPIFDITGDCIAFGGRILGDGQPKYLNSSDTPIFHKSEVLYGLDKAKSSMASTGCAIVVEGYTDVIALHKAGISNAVATLGTALGPKHIKTLSRHARRKIVYLFDGDEAGQRATERALQFLDEFVSPDSGTFKIDICALSLPDNMDPADYLGKFSADEMRSLINNAKPLILYGIERRLERHSKATAEDRARALVDALEVLSPIKNSILAKDYAAQIAQMLGYRVEDVVITLEKKSTQKSNFDRDGSSGNNIASTPNNNPFLTKRNLLERELLSACCLSPIDALNNADLILSIKWQSPVNGRIASTLMGLLSEKLDSTTGELLQRCSDNIPEASSILTFSLDTQNMEMSDFVLFLIEELQILDIQQQITTLRASLAKTTKNNVLNLESPSNIKDCDFENMINLQNDLITLKNKHTKRH